MEKFSTNAKKYWLSMSVYILFAAAAILVCPFIGSEKITISDIFNGDLQSPQADIFFQLRLPRVFMGFIAGSALAIAGAVFQVILRNPLATPYTLGVTGGSSVGAYLAICLGSSQIAFLGLSSVELLSLLGAAIVFAAIYVIARKPKGLSMNTLLLAGVTIGIFSSAVILLIRYISEPNMLVSMDRWIMGSLDITGYRSIASILPFLLPGVGLLFMQTVSLNHLSFGDELAMGQGVDVHKVQLFAFAGGSLATAAIVSSTGPIAFVGLIIPHCVRSISGFDHKIVLPACFFSGGAFLVICDTLARVIISPSQMPVGIITAMLGAPFFIYMLLNKR